VGCGQDEARQVWEARLRERPDKPWFDSWEFSDSNEVPQPIFFGEADTEQHCTTCEEYLYGINEEDE